MQTIQIEDEIYSFLLRNTLTFGESPSDVLKRLLGLESSRPSAKRTLISGSSSTASTGSPPAGDPNVVAFLNSPAYLVYGNAVEKFLAVLSWLYERKPQEFDKVLLLSGRKRRYFAKSASDLEASGNSVMPKRIPDSPFWVVTNNPTQGKKQIVSDVMRMLGYDAATIRTVIATLY
jgi:negative modulator of initiation of replication